MDVKSLVNIPVKPVVGTGIIDRQRRRALARLGLSTAGAYVAPTLLAFSPAAARPSGAKVNAAA